MALRRHQRTRSGETPDVQPEAVLLPDQWWAEGSDRAYLPTRYSLQQRATSRGNVVPGVW